jgi:S-formylglutathione hydrolase FrmB
VTVPSVSLAREQEASILLPATYAESRQRYPVLYLLHGGGQDHTAFAMRSWFRALAAREMIIVTPSVGDSWYVNSVADPKAKYEDFVVNDLVEYMDTRYRTVASREGRAVAGISMGAWGAMLLGLKHPRVFGVIGAFSAPFGISRQDPKMDMTSRTQQRFGAPDTPERLARDPGTLVATIPLDAVPMLYIACGNRTSSWLTTGDSSRDSPRGRSRMNIASSRRSVTHGISGMDSSWPSSTWCTSAGARPLVEYGHTWWVFNSREPCRRPGER